MGLERWYTKNEDVWLNPTVDQVIAANTIAYTAGTVAYFRYKVKASATVIGCQIVAATYTGDTVIKTGFYNYAESGQITKYSMGDGSITLTSTGEKTITFTTPMYFVKGVDVTIAILFVSGASNILSRASAPSTTALSWYGTTSLSALPATDSTRTTLTTYPYIEWITA